MFLSQRWCHTIQGFSIERIVGDFMHSNGEINSRQFGIVIPIAMNWMCSIESFFPWSSNFEGKSSSRVLLVVHKLAPMSWRKLLNVSIVRMRSHRNCACSNWFLFHFRELMKLMGIHGRLLVLFICKIMLEERGVLEISTHTRQSGGVLIMLWGYCLVKRISRIYFEKRWKKIIRWNKI
jgi:hypothetical protein